MIQVVTQHKVAYDSPDHIQPHGTARDNFTSIPFIEEIENYYDFKKINFLDIGCSGGQLVVDFHNRGNFSVGIEGSDYSLRVGRANWPNYGNNILFTADAVKPYEITLNSNKVLFDLITAWEVVEHIAYDDLENFFINVSNNLNDGGIFLASVATHEDVVNGQRLHQSVFEEAVWISEVFPNILKNTNLKLYKYPFKNWVRGGAQSFHIMLKKEI